MSDQFNLLDLPDLVLEQILLYCTKEFRKNSENYEKGLLKLTECCKFLKNYIETNPRLMRRIRLKVPITHPYYHEPTREDEEKNIYACLDSTRKHCTVEFYYDNQTWVRFVKESEIEEKKFLADMHSESIRDVKFEFDGTETDCKAVLDVLEFMENFINIEKVSVLFNWDIDDNIVKCKAWVLEKPAGWNWSDFGESYSFPNKLKHLKHLVIHRECQTVFNIFENCKTIKALELMRFGSENPANYVKLELLMINSRETLKTLKVQYFAHERFYYFKDFLTALINSGLNLKTFTLSAYSLAPEIIEMILRFLGSQKNLEDLDLDEISLKTAIKKFSAELAKLSKLKMLKITFCGECLLWRDCYRFHDEERRTDLEYEEIDGEDQTDVVFTLPKLLELEELNLRYELKRNRDLSFRMSQFKSDKLKKIIFSGPFKLHDSFFENISKNFGSLIELDIFKGIKKCSGYSSNDIFWILKHLKQLKTLKFIFPEDSELNPDLFDDNGNLSLPATEHGFLIFNNSVGLDHAIKFVQLMSNMSTFTFNSWKNYIPEFLVLVIKELQILSQLHIQSYSTLIAYPVLLKIQTNVQEFNKDPDNFKIQGKSLRYWIKKAEVMTLL